MGTQVFAAGLLAADKRGTMFIRHRSQPYELEDSAAEMTPWSPRVRRDSRYVKVLDPDSLAPLTSAYVGVIGAVGSAALEGREPPVITLNEVTDYPSINRDGWDELVPADTGFLIAEGTPDFHRPGPSRIVSGNHPFEPADVDAAEAGSDAILAEPLWADLHSIGAGYVEGKGLTNHIGVPIVTDAMRNWLLLSPHLICVRPIVQRPADLRR